MFANIEQEMDRLSALVLRLQDARTDTMTPAQLEQHFHTLNDAKQQLLEAIYISQAQQAQLVKQQQQDLLWDDEDFDLGDEEISLLGTEEEDFELSGFFNVTDEEKRQMLDYELMVLTYAQFNRWDQYEAYTDKLIDQIGASGYESLRREDKIYLERYSARVALG